MGNYRDLEGILRGSSNVSILILDTNNLQFYYQNESIFSKESIFSSYDLLLIPGWVHAEYSHHAEKSAYVASIPIPFIFLDECEDYLPMLEYNDKLLMELFRLAAPNSESQKFFNIHRKLEVDELSDDWIQEYYDTGFYKSVTASDRETRKNAGEASIITLAFALLSHYPNQITNVAIATSDFGNIKLKKRVLEEIEKNFLPNVKNTAPITFLTTDVSIYIAVEAGLISTQQVAQIRHNPRSSIYVENFPDGTSTVHEILVNTPDFITLLQDTHKYRIIF